MEWQDICYDIPLPRKQRKAEQAKVQDAGQLEEAPLAVPESTLSSPVKPGDRRILNGIKGSVQRGEMVAILGASGAGKTTLLNILSARVDSTGTLTGKVEFEGKPRDPASWKRTVGFVEQDDLHMDYLTVRETLAYAARLRLPDKLFSKQEKKERVEETIDILRMEKCQHTRIGSTENRGISGGERKRVSIGTELVSDVSLLLLDEPTSGLDSFQAINVVDNLREISQKRNLACLMTIHQPSYKIFTLFDKVILLTRGGVFYSGPPLEALAYFESLGMGTPEGSNPADHFIQLAENLDRTDESEKRVLSLLTSWQAHTKRQSEEKSVYPSVSKASDSSQVQREDDMDSSKEKKLHSSAATSTFDEAHLRAYRHWPTAWHSELLVMASRKFVQITRDPKTLIGTAAQTVILLIIIGFAFFRLGRSQADVLARIGVLFFIPINNTFAVIFPILSVFPLKRAIMKRERSAGMYRTSSFYLAELMVEIPSQMAQRALYYIILYWMIGLKATASAFFIFLAVNFVQVFTSVAIGLAIGAASPTVQIANILAPMINVVSLLFGGNLLPSPPPWFIWLRYISPITYAYSAFSTNEYIGETYSCDGDASSQCYATGEAVLRQYNLQTFTIAENIGFLFAIAFVWSLIGYVALRFFGHPRFRYV
ncbi:hypothetical protein CBS101457_005375 [Exobasidium rhododendri]|nr:hypothetical protein CBS101457_005375 [Exobasidium rhododendri]